MSEYLDYKMFMVRGQPRFMKNKKLVKADDVPEEVKAKLGLDLQPEAGDPLEGEIKELAKLYDYTAEVQFKDQTDNKGRATPTVKITLIRDGKIMGRYATARKKWSADMFQQYMDAHVDQELWKLRERTKRLQTIKGPSNTEVDVSQSAV